MVKSWYRIPEAAQIDDNPDIDDYLGQAEVWAYYFRGKSRLGLMLRHNLETTHRRGAVQAEYSFPLTARVNAYLQFFSGYGESLIDYNHYIDRFGVGILLRDWD